jgi:hypothetical protein
MRPKGFAIIKYLVRGLPYLAIIPADPNPPVVGINYFNLDAFMGQSLGWLKWPTLFGLIFAVAAFGASAYFLVQYTRRFFAGRKIPRSWKFILWGLFITSIAELGELFGFYEWPKAGLIEANILLLVPHALGGVFIGLGAFFLYKEARP